MMRVVLASEWFTPGATVEGRVEDAGLAPLKVSIVWRTSGKGDADHAEVGSVELDPRAPTFSLRLPLLPLSYEGQLLKIQWFVVVKSVAGSSEVPFVVRWPKR
ncbi:MAG: hypothetical protein U0271_06285 [Polyangiaceae bacterium]